MAKVRFNKPSTYTVGDVMLIAGENDVPQDKMEAFLAHPHVKIKIKSGLIEVVDKKQVRTEDDTGGDDEAKRIAAEKAAAAKAEKDAKDAAKAAAAKGKAK
jgi:hypothetical protein